MLVFFCGTKIEEEEKKRMNHYMSKYVFELCQLYRSVESFTTRVKTFQINSFNYR